MFNEDDVGLLRDYVDDIFECLDKLVAGKKNDFDAGQVCAFLHILRMIQGNIFDDRLRKSLGLDIDIDKKYLRHKWNGDI